MIPPKNENWKCARCKTLEGERYLIKETKQWLCRHCRYKPLSLTKNNMEEDTKTVEETAEGVEDSTEAENAEQSA